MTTQHKQTTLGGAYLEGDPLAASAPSVLRREPFARAGRSQDTILAGSRQLVSQHHGGPYEFLTDSTATGGVSQTKPDQTTWRTVARARCELSAGCVLLARAVSVPSGATEVLESANWNNGGNDGSVRFVVRWDNVAADSDTLTTEFDLPGEDDDGAEDTTAGAAWAHLSHHWALGVQPPDAAAQAPAEQAKWSEWPTLSIDVDHRGGARVIHASLTETAYKHVVAHTVYESTCNGTPSNEQLVDRYPVEEVADGATYDDHRYGVHRLLYAAERQTARVGPRICSWSAWSEATATITGTEAAAVSITNTTPERLSWDDGGTQTAWDADAPGFDIPQTMAAPNNLSTRLDGAGVSPVRARVYARFSGAGSATGYLRLWSTARSWIEVEVDQATVGTTFAWITVTGWLETNVAGDDAYAIVQDFAYTTSGTLEIRYWDLTYGAFATGA